MPRWRRVVTGGIAAAWLTAALIVAVPGSASTARAAADEPSNDVCEVLEPLGEANPALRAAVTEKLLDALDVSPTTASEAFAQRIRNCTTGQDDAPQANDATADATVCTLAAAFRDRKELEASLDLIDAWRQARTDDALCWEVHQEVSAAEPPTVDAQGLGDLWANFQAEVVKPLAPIASFVSLAALTIFALARLIVFLGLFRDRRSSKWGRRTAFTVGLLLAFAVPSFMAARAMWFADRPGSGYSAEPNFRVFLTQILSWAWGWWLLLLGLAIVAILSLAYCFANLRQMTIEITPKEDGSGLDKTRLMTAMDSMAGRPNRGIEFPVGTDLVDETKAIAQYSSNKFVAAIESFAGLLFGTSPWRLKVENETGDAVSVAISRNGRLKVARRLTISGTPLETIPAPAEVSRLAALVSGEVIAALAPMYPSELGPGLNGATNATSVTYHYIASTALSSNRTLRSQAEPLLRKALAIDPSNRRAAATLENFVYRDPEGAFVDHIRYQRFLEKAIDNELKQMCTRRYISVLSSRIEWWFRDEFYNGPVLPLPDGTTKISRRRLSRNDLLLRLLQTYVVATRNLAAAKQTATGDAGRTPYESLWIYLNARLKQKRGQVSPVLYASRRQSFLIDRFSGLEWSPQTGSARVPTLREDGFLRRERRVWVAAGADVDSLDSRFKREEAVLRLHGDFDQDPKVMYTLACYRTTKWYTT